MCSADHWHVLFVCFLVGQYEYDRQHLRQFLLVLDPSLLVAPWGAPQERVRNAGMADQDSQFAVRGPDGILEDSQCYEVASSPESSMWAEAKRNLLAEL
jgi:hypothetical protein